MHVEGHPVGQAPAVAGRGVCTGPEQSQVAAVVVRVLVLPGREVHSGLVQAWVDGKNGLAHPLGHPSGGPAQTSGAAVRRAVHHSCRKLGREQGSQRWSLGSLSASPRG